MAGAQVPRGPGDSAPLCSQDGDGLEPLEDAASLSFPASHMMLPLPRGQGRRLEVATGKTLAAVRTADCNVSCIHSTNNYCGHTTAGLCALYWGYTHNKRDMGPPPAADGPGEHSEQETGPGQEWVYERRKATLGGRVTQARRVPGA